LTPSSLGRADKAIVITTGSFTLDAKKEARRDGVPLKTKPNKGINTDLENAGAFFSPVMPTVIL